MKQLFLVFLTLGMFGCPRPFHVAERPVLDGAVNLKVAWKAAEDGAVEHVKKIITLTFSQPGEYEVDVKYLTQTVAQFSVTITNGQPPQIKTVEDRATLLTIKKSGAVESWALGDNLYSWTASN